ncbi:MAG: thiamine phosphate synthase [Chloroherpetonaceae bacterium]|nr:thiamine phosphate synthase [Chloroherpetonaceae bacterium]
MIQSRLLLITDRKACGERTLEQVVEASCKNGVRLVQFREKDVSPRDAFGYAKALREITVKYGAKLIINSFLDIALAVDADGIHLSSTGIPIHEIRKQKPNLLLGKSTHSLSEALEAQLQGADYIQFGPVYDTPSKKIYGQAQGVEKLSVITSKLHIPVFAVGGITPENASACMNAGAAGIAVIRSLMTAKDISRTLQSFNLALS